MSEIALEVLPLFPELDDLLLSLLRGLHPTEWDLPTVAGRWRVRDVALHLLDGNLRTLSMLRDGHFTGPGPASGSYADVVSYLNRLNQEWLNATQRLSSDVIIELLAQSGPSYYEYLTRLDPLAPATFAVAWAGEETSKNWFHIARDYTEKWHHQQQIRLAVGQEAALYQPAFYQPYLAISMRAILYRLREFAAEVGDHVVVEVSGQGEGIWAFQRGPAGWELLDTIPAETTTVRTHLLVPGALAWRLFSKNITPAEALPYVVLKGDQHLGQWLLGTVAVMA